ncbi:hypothetical protein QYF61_008339 [Mycteria americana]|uniref:Uncharacterized protein n=1 Tax=Mycteria americana TaxID=33587 RepID=A0AAN7SBM3_MYCAM|nr:hypothetical protein QYF61_008339 [Mycteria americana]
MILKVFSNLHNSVILILLLGQCNTGYTYVLGDERLECSLAERDLGVLVDGKLSMSQQCALVAKRAHHILGCIEHSIANWSEEVIAPLYSALFWTPQYKKDVKILECVQKEGNKDCERTRGHDLRGAAEDTRFVQLRGDCRVTSCCLQFLHEEERRGRC